MRRSFAALAAVAATLAFEMPALAQAVGAEFRVNTYTSSSYHGRVASDAGGSFVIVWVGSLTSGADILARRFDAGGNAIGGAFRVNTYTSLTPNHFQSAPSISMAGTGQFVVVWDSIHGGGSNYDIFGQRFDLDGTPLGGEFRVNTVSANRQQFASAAMSGNGNFVVVWESEFQDDPQGTSGVFGQRFGFNGAPLGAAFRVNTSTTNAQDNPQVAAEEFPGAFIVTWMDLAPPVDVYAQRFTSAGAPAGAAFLVNQYTTNNQIFPSVAIDATTSHFMVTWRSKDEDGSDYGVFGRRYDAVGAPASEAFRINTYTSLVQANQRVIPRIGSGGFVVVWDSNGRDGSSYAVLGQGFDSGGAVIGGEFRINTYTTGLEFNSGVSAGPAGTFVVTWVRAGGGPASVSAQLFSDIPTAGDADGNGVTNVSDILYLINSLFAGGPLPTGQGDANGDGVINVSDILYLINYLFAGGPPPI